MSIQQFCTPDVVTIDIDATARDAAIQMGTRHVGALVVTRRQAQRLDIVGLVTDRDLVLNALARHPAPAEAPVGGLMSARVVAVPATASIADTALTMHEEGVRRILVVDADGTLVGIVSLDDLIEALSAEMADVTQGLRTGMARERARHPRLTASGLPDEALSLPPEALARRWRQISAP